MKRLLVVLMALLVASNCYAAENVIIHGEEGTGGGVTVTGGKLDTNATFSGTVELGAGTATIGKLAANDGVDIGDVDVASLPVRTISSNRIQATINSADASSATQVVAKVAGENIYILSIMVTTDTELNFQLQDDAGTPAVLMENIYLAANGGFVMNFPPEAPLVVATNQDLDIIASGAGNVSVTVTGYQE